MRENYSELKKINSWSGSRRVMVFKNAGESQWWQKQVDSVSNGANFLELSLRNHDMM